MKILTSWRERYRQVEGILAITIVFLKLRVLFATWGKPQGFDCPSWLEMFRLVRWFEPLPPPLTGGGNYHPPLSHLIGRLIYAVYPHEVEASQVASTLALLIAFFAMRALLLRIGVLYTVSGFWILYGGFSLPLFVFLAVETTYDSWVLAWFMLVFLCSVVSFWIVAPKTWWKSPRYSVGLLLLGSTLALGMLNKYSGLIAFSLPFLTIFSRRGLRAVFREISAPLFAITIGVMLASPLYYQRYYKAEGHWMPTAMDFQLTDRLVYERAKRDAAPVDFVAKMLRVPLAPREDEHTPVMDSFVDLTWFHTWKKDSWLGEQPPLSMAISQVYSKAFAWLSLSGAAYFCIRHRQILARFRHFGLILVAVACLYSASALCFAWKYPVWDWRVFKTKYMSAAALCIVYLASVPFQDGCFYRRHSIFVRAIEETAFFSLLAFMFINHLVPVY